MHRMIRRWFRWVVAVMLAVVAPVPAPQALQSPDLVAAEIAIWLAAITRDAGSGPLWDQVKPVAQGALIQAQTAQASGRRWFALERLAAARALLSAAMYVAERPPDVRKSVGAFESEWRRMGTTLGATLTTPASEAPRVWPSSAVRALAEVASHQVKVNYDASLTYGRATDADSGLYYLGAAQAQQQFVSFAHALPRGAATPLVLRTLESDAQALEQRLLALYQPPASIDRHAEFIAASAALKEARELNDAGLRHGALLKFLQATQRTAQLQAMAVPDLDVLRARLARVQQDVDGMAGDHSLVRVFLERAAVELATASPEAAGLSASAAILDSVLPTYLAALGPAPPVTPVADASVTVRLVRWPFT
jgi:hypothetical protein